MRVLVTGHEGYIGAIAVRVLRAAGHEVAGVDAGLFLDGRPTPNPDVPRVGLDVRDLREDDLAGLDAIVHLAAIANDPMGELRPELTLAINHRATVDLARRARAAGVARFVLSSSCSMYGAAAGDDEVAEDAPLRPLTAYAESKVRAEEDLAALADDGFSPVFLRNATAYGASPALRSDLVLNNLVGWAHHTGRVRITSDGSPWRPLVHVADIAGAAAAALVAPRERVHGQTLNVGRDGENSRVREIAAIVERTVPACRIEYAGGAGPDARSYGVSFRRLGERLPEFAPRWTVPEHPGRAGHGDAMLRRDDPHFEEFGEIYFSVVYPGVVKGWHLHTRMTLNYSVVSGMIKLVLYDEREGSATRGELMELFVGDQDYRLVRIPPGVWNGTKGIGVAPAIIANCATLPHDPEEIVRADPHDGRIPYDWAGRDR